MFSLLRSALPLPSCSCTHRSLCCYSRSIDDNRYYKPTNIHMSIRIMKIMEQIPNTRSRTVVEHIHTVFIEPYV